MWLGATLAWIQQLECYGVCWKIESRDICKYKAPFIVTVLQKCNFHRLVVWKPQNPVESGTFDTVRGLKPVYPSSSPERLYSEIGRLKMDWLKKNPESACKRPEAMDRPRSPLLLSWHMDTLHAICQNRKAVTHKDYSLYWLMVPKGRLELPPEYSD